MKQLFLKALIGLLLGVAYGALTSGLPGIIVWGIFGLVAGLAFEVTGIVTELVDRRGYGLLGRLLGGLAVWIVAWLIIGLLMALAT